MVSSMNDCFQWGSMMWHALFYLYQIAVSCANGSIGNKYLFLCLISFTRCYIFPWILGTHKDIFQWIFGRQIFQWICWKQVLFPMSDISEHIKISSNGSLEEHKSSLFGWTFCTDWFACIYKCWTFKPDFYIQNNKHKHHHVTDCQVEFHLATFLPWKPNTPQQPTNNKKKPKQMHTTTTTRRHLLPKLYQPWSAHQPKSANRMATKMPNPL